jgi:dTDP-4-amino-4,6-dideoxygalactose transaminase
MSYGDESMNSYIRYAEKKLADYVNVKNVILTSMGRTAFVTALKALDVDQRSEVILPSFTCKTLVEAVRYCNANTVFADVDPFTFNITPQEIEKSLTPRTKAIVTIHCYGQPSDMDEILEIARKKSIPVIEDVAHALGAEYKGKKVGCFGDFSFFSFSKNMGASSGGALATNSLELAEKAKSWISSIHKSVAAKKRLPMKHRVLGFARKHKSFLLPLLSSLKLLKRTTKLIASSTEEIPSSFGANPAVAAEVAEKLKRMDEINLKRIQEAQILRRMLEGSKLTQENNIGLPYEANDRKHVYYLFAVKVYDRNRFLPKLGSLKKYVYIKGPWKCSNGVQAQKLSEQLVLLEMNPASLKRQVVDWY